ncbi:MAG: PBP1A family penicillin-binding protein [Hyphomicrobiaceae bacterium]|nr:PBP1A family penicillin-binding protein [Hyphomicrobiaceae bacterium]
MHEWFFRQGGRRRLIDWLGIDAWIDSSLNATWEGLKDRWNALTTFAARFRLTGWQRILNEIVSEGMTIGVGGLAVMFVLALPAFNEFDEGKFLQGKFAVKFLDRNGVEIGSRGLLHNDSVPLAEIPDTLIKATLATEDRRFFEHFGVDVLGTMRALIENARANEVVQGGSTLTQQLAKNLFLSSERSFERKLKELFLSFLLETRFTKRQILKMYFDRAYLGGGAVGVEAASQFYFGKSVREINLAEAAVIAGLFKAPSKFAPHINLPASRARTNEVLNNLVEAGYMTAGQVAVARLNPAKTIETRPTHSPDWFLDWAFEEVQRIAEGRGQYVLTARTTVDLELQQLAQEALINTLRQTGTVPGAPRQRGSINPFTGAVVSMEPDGAVRALVGGVDYEENQFNRASHARRQPGSSFKLYVYATAFEEGGLGPKSIVQDFGGQCGNWAPRNYSGGGGSGRSLMAIDAFKVSLNVPAVVLSLKYGREKVIEMTQRLGVAGVRKTCSMALGDTGITPLDHTGAYAAFANGGKLAKGYAVLELFNSKGELIYSRDRDEPAPEQVVSRRTVEGMNQMMQAVVSEGTARKAILDFTTAAGKTGTSTSYRDAWFVGFTGALVTGVWIGHDDFKPMHWNGGVTGGSLPTMVWHAFMSVAHKNRPIPVIPGLQPHPNQIADQQRMAELRRTDPAMAEAQAAQQPRKSLMPDQTRNALRKVADSMRAAGGAAKPAAPGTGEGVETQPVPVPRPGEGPRGRSTELPPQERRAEMASPIATSSTGARP